MENMNTHTDQMTPNKINKRIAIACGWSTRSGWKLEFERWHEDPEHYWICPVTLDRCEPPDYYNDLNAMHEAERGMGNYQWWKFVSHLTDICGGGTALGISATAPQRAEAFLRTIGKWEDGE